MLPGATHFSIVRFGATHLILCFFGANHWIYCFCRYDPFSAACFGATHLMPLQFGATNLICCFFSVRHIQYIDSRCGPSRLMFWCDPFTTFFPGATHSIHCYSLRPIEYNVYPGQPISSDAFRRDPFSIMFFGATHWICCCSVRPISWSVVARPIYYGACRCDPFLVVFLSVQTI